MTLLSSRPPRAALAIVLGSLVGTAPLHSAHAAPPAPQSPSETPAETAAPPEATMTPQPGAPQPAAPQPTAPQPPSPQPTEPQPAVPPATQDSPVPGADPSTGPLIHVVDMRPDESKGVLKLVRYSGTSSQAAPNAIVVTTHYDEICTVPCGVRVDTSERPKFFFIRDEQPASYAFRLPQNGEHTIELKAVRKGMRNAGVYLTYSIILFPIGVPLWVAGSSKIKIAEGSPDSATDFRRLKKAR